MLFRSSYFTSQTILASPTTTRVTSTANPATYGQLISITASVSTGDPSVATGNVTFTDNGVYAGACSLGAITPGACSIISNGYSVGSHVIVATYQGDTNHTGSTAAPFTQVISQAPTVTTIASSANPSTIGDASVRYTDRKSTRLNSSH